MSVSLQHLFSFGQSAKSTRRENSSSDRKYPYYSIAFTRDTSAAALACAEALERPGLNQEILDNLLISSLAEHLAEQFIDRDKQGLRELATDLLQPAKDSLQQYYQESRKNNPDFEDIVQSAHEECDFEFLKLVVGLYSREFVRQTAI